MYTKNNYLFYLEQYRYYYIYSNNKLKIIQLSEVNKTKFSYSYIITSFNKCQIEHINHFHKNSYLLTSKSKFYEFLYCKNTNESYKVIPNHTHEWNKLQKINAILLEEQLTSYFLAYQNQYSNLTCIYIFKDYAVTYSIKNYIIQNISTPYFFNNIINLTKWIKENHNDNNLIIISNTISYKDLNKFLKNHIILDSLEIILKALEYFFIPSINKYNFPIINYGHKISFVNLFHILNKDNIIIANLLAWRLKFYKHLGKVLLFYLAITLSISTTILIGNYLYKNNYNKKLQAHQKQVKIYQTKLAKYNKDQLINKKIITKLKINKKQRLSHIALLNCLNPILTNYEINNLHYTNYKLQVIINSQNTKAFLNNTTKITSCSKWHLKSINNNLAIIQGTLIIKDET